MAVTGAFPTVAGDFVSFADATGRENQSLGMEDFESTSLAVVAHRADDAIAIFQQRDDSELHVDVDALVDAVILQRADHFKAGTVANVREARIAMAAEVALKDFPIGRAIEDGAPSFEFADAIGRFLSMELGHAPVVDVLPAAHRVGKMHA